MIAEGVLLPLTIMTQGSTLQHVEPSVWLVTKEQNTGVELTLNLQGEKQVFRINNDGLIIFDRGPMQVTQGPLVYRKVNHDMFSKLLAFVDTAIETTRAKNENNFTFLRLPEYHFLCDQGRSEKWFLQAILNDDQWVKPLCQLLRKTECYGLVQYLLSESTACLSLYELGRVYGLSYSHFRRLCRTALGGKVKAELCGWRMARCILEIIEGKTDMTTIAHKYGYSSSSHFSAEVKNKIGKSPRDLCRHSCSGKQEDDR